MYKPEAYNNKYIRKAIWTLIDLCKDMKEHEIKCLLTGTDLGHPMDSTARDYRWALERLKTFLEDNAHWLDDVTVGFILDRFNVKHLAQPNKELLYNL